MAITRPLPKPLVDALTDVESAALRAVLISHEERAGLPTVVREALDALAGELWELQESRAHASAIQEETSAPALFTIVGGLADHADV